MRHRYQLERYIESNPKFLTTLEPYPMDPYAPPLIRDMIESSGKTKVGPMASVAGAIAQYVGLDLLDISDQVIVENGGDIFLDIRRPVTVSIFAGDSSFSEKIGLLIKPDIMPLGVCSSSRSVGHSLSMGKSDTICLVSSSAIIADGAATFLGNRIREKKDLEKVADWANQIEDILGGVGIMGDTMVSWGDIELISF